MWINRKDYDALMDKISWLETKCETNRLLILKPERGSSEQNASDITYKNLGTYTILPFPHGIKVNDHKLSVSEALDAICDHLGFEFVKKPDAEQKKFDFIKKQPKKPIKRVK